MTTTPDPALLLARKIAQDSGFAGWVRSIAEAAALAAIRETTERAAAYIQSPEGIPSHIFPDVISALRANRHLEEGSSDA